MAVNQGMMVAHDPYYVDEEEAKYGTVDDLLVQFKVLNKAMVLGLWEGMEQDYKRVKVALLHIVEAKTEVDAAKKKVVLGPTQAFRRLPNLNFILLVK